MENITFYSKSYELQITNLGYKKYPLVTSRWHQEQAQTSHQFKTIPVCYVERSKETMCQIRGFNNQDKTRQDDLLNLAQFYMT